MRKIVLLSILAVLFFVPNVFALSDGYELFAGDPVYLSAPYEFDAQGKFGVYIWANDEARRDWSIRWTNDGAENGSIQNYRVDLGLNVATENPNSIVDIAEFANTLENHNSVYDSIIDFGDNQYILMNKTGAGDDNQVWYDGVDFSIVGDTLPSYLYFDIALSGIAPDEMENYIFIGDYSTTNANPVSQDFKIAAPVPEPATLLLLGSGLVGLAFLKRRKS